MRRSTLVRKCYKIAEITLKKLDNNISKDIVYGVKLLK